MYASFFGISGAWYLNLFEQPVKMGFSLSCSFVISISRLSNNTRNTFFNPLDCHLVRK